MEYHEKNATKIPRKAPLYRNYAHWRASEFGYLSNLYFHFHSKFVVCTHLTILALLFDPHEPHAFLRAVTLALIFSI